MVDESDGFELIVEDDDLASGAADIGGRQFFRAPVKPPRELMAKVTDDFLRLYDISEGGLCLVIPEKDFFSLGQELDSIQLELEKHTITVQGQVVHIFPYIGSSYRCGLKITGFTGSSQQILQEYVSVIRKELFE